MSKKKANNKQIHTDSFFSTKRSKYFGAKLPKYHGIYNLKNEHPFQDICYAVKSVKEKNPLYKYVHANPVPNSYAQLGQLNESFWIPSAKSLDQEINWTLLTVRKFKDKINLFLEYKKLYEKSLLLGDYVLADSFLSKIENEVCFSIWSLENRFLLLEQSGFPEKHKLFLSDFSKNAEGIYVRFLASQSSNKSERNFSVLKYNSDLNAILSHLKDEIGESHKEYYYFKLNKFNYKEYKSYARILSYESYHSVIDRYLTLVSILKLAYSDANTSFIMKSFIASKSKYLLTKFNDNSLRAIVSVHNPKYLNKVKDSNFNLDAIDLYTSGRFEEASKLLGKSLLENPEIFEYYPLYVKSFIYSNKPFRCPSGGEIHISLQNSILHEILSQLTKSVNPNTLSVSLERYIKNLSSSSIADGLFGFYYKEFSRESYWNKYNCLSQSSNNPSIVTFLENDDERYNYLESLADIYQDSSTINYFLKRDLIKEQSVYNSLGIPEFIKKVHLGKLYQDEENYEKATLIWEELIKDSFTLVPIYETAIVNLFSCYTLSNKQNEAISLYVNNYLINKFIVQRVQNSVLRKDIRNKKFKGIKSSIDLPLFYTISEADENEIHIAYEKYLDSLGIEKPSEMDFSHITNDKNKVILFLSLTCTTELFKHSIYIDGSKEGTQERITILRHLQVIDSLNGEEYKKEIDSLTNNLILQEGLQQLDESKIYVNEPGLINSELKEFEGLYNRYNTISRIFGSNRPLTFFVQSSEDLVVKGDSKSNPVARFSDHPLKDSFKEIFEVIIDKFLHSKFGISAYLSTRIRHGVLLGEVRPVFEKNYLIAQFDKIEGKYRDVDYWKSKYPFVIDSNMDKLQSAIALLSNKVDNIIHELIKSNLQIRVDSDNDKAWFDYYFDDIDLTLYSMNARDANTYADFVKKSIEILWERTDKNLEKIRRNILGEVRDSFNSVISEFTSELQGKYLNKIFPEVLTNVNTCSTEVQNSIEKVASWFNRSGSQTSDFHISKVINIVIEKLNQSYQSKSLDYTLNIENDIIIRGEFYSHIADLFRIFFDNALNHSLEREYLIPVLVDIKSESGWLLISIKNMYPDPMKTKNISQQNEQKVNMHKLYTEGKSGFHKASKIIKSDLKHDRNEYFKEIDSENRYCVNLKISIDKLIYEISSN